MAVLGGLLALLAPVQAATAQKTNAQEMAGARFKSGVALFSHGDFARAYLEFVQAQSIYSRPAVIWNLAVCELRLNKPLEALVHLRQFIAAPDTSADMRALAERNLSEAYVQTGHISITAPEGWHISVDSLEVGIAPLKQAVDVVAGLHGVDAVGGKTSLHEAVTAPANKLTEVAFVAPAVADTHVVVGGDPGFVPIAPPPVGHVEEPERVNQSHTARDVLRWGTAGVALVGVAVGVGFFVDGSSQASAFKSYVSSHPSACFAPASAACTQGHTLSSDASQSGTIETVGFVVGGVAAAASLALWAFWPRDSATSTGTLWFSPAVVDGSYSFHLGGAF